MRRALQLVEVAGALVCATANAHAHPFSTRDVVDGPGATALDPAGWTCRISDHPAGSCDAVVLPPGRRQVQVSIQRTIHVPQDRPRGTGGASLSLGHFATETAVILHDGPPRTFPPGLVFLEDALYPGANTVTILTNVSPYRAGRPAWDFAARWGLAGERRSGLLVATAHPGTRLPYVVQIPDAFDERRPATVIVALHPWGVGPWAYVGTELSRRAARDGTVLLFPDGLGNSLWVGDAEGEALAAIDALRNQIAIDPDRVYLFGASMGGAGATTIGYHHPDRFAAVASFFGDSRYGQTGYHRAILTTEGTLRAASSALFAENARNLRTLLVHGALDTTSPVVQTTALRDRLRAEAFDFEAVVRPDRGHEQRLVDEETGRMLDFFARSRRSASPARVSFRAVAPTARSAYWLTVIPDGPGWAFADVAIDPGTNAVRVLARDNVRRILVDRARSPLAAGRAVDAPAFVTVR